MQGIFQSKSRNLAAIINQIKRTNRKSEELGILNFSEILSKNLIAL